MGPAIVVAPLLYLDPTYCQIPTTLHISLSEIEQVALNFTSPQAVVDCSLLRFCQSIAGASAVVAGASASIAGVASPALRPPSPALRIACSSAAVAVVALPTLRPPSPARALALTTGFEGLAFRMMGQQSWLFRWASGHHPAVSGTGRLVDITTGIRNPCRHLCH